jgi:hypothetical protein
MNKLADQFHPPRQHVAPPSKMGILDVVCRVPGEARHQLCSQCSQTYGAAGAQSKPLHQEPTSQKVKAPLLNSGWAQNL